MNVQRLAPAFVAVLSLGCGSSAVRQPPGKPPTPATISVAEPGGDAHDAHEAALLRQLHEPWGRRNDKDDEVHVPTPDWEHWKRVRYWGFEHFAGWRYGDDHHVAALLVLLDLKPGERNDSASCIRRFEAWARPQAQAYGMKIDAISQHSARWHDQPIVVMSADGHANSAFARHDYSAAWAAYPAYPDACAIYAMGIPWRGHEALAKQVRDRWVAEGFPGYIPRTPTKPVRKP